MERETGSIRHILSLLLKQSDKQRKNLRESCNSGSLFMSGGGHFIELHIAD